MLRYIIVILSLWSFAGIANDLPDSPSEAYKQYVKMREGYKRSSTKQFSRTEQFEMDDYCFDMEEKFPTSFESKLMWHINDHYIGSDGTKLKAAYAIAPKNKDVLKAMLSFYIMTGNKAKQNEFAAKVAGFYSKNELAYYRDVFPSSGVIIASSEKDALPLYINQLVKGKGTTVTVVTMDYLINDLYRISMSSKLGTGSMKFFGSEKTFIKKAMLSSSSVYVSSTVSQSYLADNLNNSFLTGLYYQSGITKQESQLELFWKNVAAKNFASISLTRSEKRLYRNYLPPLLTLYKFKLNAGKQDNVLRKAIELIAEKVEQTKTVNEILIDYESN